MSKAKTFGVLAALMVGLVPVTAAADPIDNPDTADFIWYNNQGSPFLHFYTDDDPTDGVDSDVVIDSYLSSGPSSSFRADVDSFGAMDFVNGNGMQYYPTGLDFGGPIDVKLAIVNVEGTSDCSGSTVGGGDCEVDWEMTAQLWFDGGLVDEASCMTSSFSIFVDGTWDDVTSPIVVPPLSGSGTQSCGFLAMGLNNYFGFGTDDATLSLYKYATETFAGGPLVGSP